LPWPRIVIPNCDDVEDLRVSGELGEHDHAAEKQQQRRDPADVVLGLGGRQQPGQHAQHASDEQPDPDPVEHAELTQYREQAT
jgi:hypothetical protein